MKIHTIPLFAAITLFNCYASMGQNSMYANEFNFNSGIYQTIADFKSNSPLACNIDKSTLIKNQAICLKDISCTDGSSHKSKSLWGLCLDGRPFVKYKKCFFPIIQFGQLSTFYYVEVYESPDRTRMNRINSNLREMVIDLKTGIIYDQNFQALEIAEIIKSDGYFKDEKIKRKDLGAYITQYNKRHGL